MRVNAMCQSHFQRLLAAISKRVAQQTKLTHP